MLNVTYMKERMKVLRVKQDTFDRLIATGRWSDSMDEIVSALLDKMEGNEEGEGVPDV